MRCIANSGFCSKPAAFASRNNSARCATERALCWPPTTVKCDWGLLSQAVIADYATGVYAMWRIAEIFDVHYATVGRAVSRSDM